MYYIIHTYIMHIINHKDFKCHYDDRKRVKGAPALVKVLLEVCQASASVQGVPHTVGNHRRTVGLVGRLLSCRTDGV